MQNDYFNHMKKIIFLSLLLLLSIFLAARGNKASNEAKVKTTESINNKQ
jgi:hypothetical protein